MKVPFLNRAAIAMSIALLILSASCGERDAICDCIDAGDQLNKKANEILRSEPTDKSEKELQALRKIKKTKCSEFETMAGPEMLERKQSCD